MVKKFKMFLIIALVIVIVVVLGSYFGKSYNLFQLKTERSSQASLLQDHLMTLSELAVLKYEYRNVIVSRLDQALSLPGLPDINYAETIKLITYSGYLKAGTDLSKATLEYDATSKTITVRIQKSQILDNVVETEKTKVEDIKGNIFSNYSPQTIFDEINAHKKQLQEEKISQGFLEEADERIRLVLTSFLKSKEYENVVIEFL